MKNGVIYDVVQTTAQGEKKQVRNTKKMRQPKGENSDSQHYLIHDRACIS